VLLRCLAFWLLLVLPGYALVRGRFRADMKAGLLSAVALSYVGTFLLLSPLSLACYAMGWPLGVFIGGCGALCLAAGIHLTWTRAWRELADLAAAAMSLELFIVIALLVLAARAGSHFDGDTIFHLARVRFLGDHGLTNQSPYFEFPAFVGVYHSNLFHALLAAGASVTRTDDFAMWRATLAWANVVAMGGCYTLAWQVFGRQAAAWTAAIAAGVSLAPVTMLTYPNKLAAFWLLTLMIGFAVEALRAGARWDLAFKLAATSFVLGQVHALYAVFGGLVVAPVLLVALVKRLWRPAHGRLALVGCLAALWAGAPFVLHITARFGTPAPAEAPQPATEPVAKEPHYDRFLHFDGGWLMERPGRIPRDAYLAAAAVALTLLTRRRRDAVALVFAVLVPAALLLVPPLCAWSVALFGKLWILLRLHVIWRLVVLATLPGLAAYLAEPWACKRWGGPWRSTGLRSDRTGAGRRAVIPAHGSGGRLSR